MKRDALWVKFQKEDIPNYNSHLKLKAVGTKEQIDLITIAIVESVIAAKRLETKEV